MTIVRIGQNSAGDDFTGITDTELTQGSPTSNSHTNEIIEITKFGAGDHRDGLMVIDFSAFRTSISNQNITLAGVTLNFYATQVNPGGLTVGVYKSNRAAVASQATWNIYSTGNPWTAGGGRGNGTDRVGTAIGTLATLAGGQYNQVTLDAATVQAIINAGNPLVLGFERTDGADDGQFSLWRSSDNSTTTERPYITLDYSIAASPATLSAPTPSGTIGTQTTATIGATTDQTSGTFYAVVDTTANLAGVTAAEIKAGQKAGGAAALASANSSVTTTSPSAGVTGLTAATAYGYAAIQNNANGDSNIVTGTFTTAAAVPQSSPPPSRGARIAVLMLT